MKEEVFVKTMAPKFGPGVIGTMNDAQKVAVWELLIRKGVFTREELTAEVEKQLGIRADSLAKTPIPSPYTK